MPDRNPSVHHEPHMQVRALQGDPSEKKIAAEIEYEVHTENFDDKVHHSVWGEPGVSRSVSGAPPEDALTYENWLDGRMQSVGLFDTWVLVFCWCLFAGPLSIIGTLVGGVVNATMLLPLHIVVIGPVIEELMKLIIPLWVVERRPYLFRSTFQIFMCAIAGGVSFAVVENMMYLGYDFLNWDNPLTRWRWTVCVALHTFCCMISALGLSRIWRTTMREKKPPQVQLGVPYMVTAIAVHGTYNAFALMFEWIYEPF